MFGIFTVAFTVRFGVVNVPVKVGPDILDFKFNALWVAVDTGLFASLVLSILATPTVVFDNPFTDPIKLVIPDKVVLNKEEPDKLDFKFKLDCKSIPFKVRDGIDKLELSDEPPLSKEARLFK